MKVLIPLMLLASVAKADVYAISTDDGKETVYANKAAAIRFVLLNEPRVKQITETRTVVLTSKLSFKKKGSDE